MSALHIGVDVGGSKIQAVALERDNSVVASFRAPTPTLKEKDCSDSPSRLVAAVAEVVAQLRRSSDVFIRRWEAKTTAVGVGLPGLVDRAGALVHSAHLPGAVGTTRSMLEEALGQKVVVENDATAATIGEQRCGVLVGVENAIMMTVGTGIGAGVIIDGCVRVGQSGFLGEVGHMVLDPNGPLCACGLNGCFEAFASGLGLARLRSEDGGDGEAIASAARMGDVNAQSVIDEWARWMAIGLNDLVALFDPRVIALGGGVLDSADVLWGPLLAAFKERRSLRQSRSDVDLVPAANGSLAGAVGAAVMAR